MQHISAAPYEGEGIPGLACDDDDVALVRAARENRAAFGLLYERYVDRIYAYLRARTGNPEDAADLTQQVFLQALEALPRYRVGQAPFAAWLFRIARNAAINAHRRRPHVVAWDLVPEALQPVVEDDLAAGLIQRERVARLRTLFGALDAGARELLVLRFTARLTMAEVAAVIGVSEGAAKMRLIRALRSLKEHYHDDPR
jgi:RNA polymerase sigma-70 factor (ECF subfamily)